jgi:hypothetical protein
MLDGAPISLALGEFANDGDTFVEAGRMLDEHPSGDHIDIWDGDRAVVARHREQPIVRPVKA